MQEAQYGRQLQGLKNVQFISLSKLSIPFSYPQFGIFTVKGDQRPEKMR